MSYLCTVCHAHVPSGQQQRHVITRLVERLGQQVEEIARELPVCPACKHKLDAGVSLRVLQEQYRPIAVPLALKFFQRAVESQDAAPPPRSIEF